MEGDSEGFKSLIDTLRLIYMENIDDNFTWSNQRLGTQHIASRLDRFLISEPLMMDGFLMEANILFVAGSNHWPI
jgi:exonuclease III